MERTSNKITKQLGGDVANISWKAAKKWGNTPKGQKVEKGEVLFPRLDIEKELKKLTKANEKLIKERINKKQKKEDDKMEEITIDHFAKLDLKVAEIVEVKEHPNADKLLTLKLNLGDETRQVVSGIKQFYSPEDLIGKKVVLVANLKPIKLRGEESYGMILATEKNGKLTLVSTLEDIEAGATIS